MKENFHIGTIKYVEKVTADATEDSAETEEEKFIAVFIIMTDLFNSLLTDLLKICEKKVVIRAFKNRQNYENGNFCGAFAQRPNYSRISTIATTLLVMKECLEFTQQIS